MLHKEPLALQTSGTRLTREGVSEQEVPISPASTDASTIVASPTAESLSSTLKSPVKGSSYGSISTARLFFAHLG